MCAYTLGENEALVACRMLGFNRTRALAVSSVKYGEGSGPTMIYNPQCQGMETSLDQCEQRNKYYYRKCEDVGVICSMDVLNITKQMTARLVNGTSTSGRLEILFNGEWGTVCYWGFGQNEAKVACRMLGLHSTGATAFPAFKYGQGQGHILLKSVECQGTELSLTECKLDFWHSRGCRHEKDVGVVCNITKPMTARLYGGTSKAGRLEIFFNGEWNTVCKSEFDQRKIDMACKMLGLNSTGQAAVVAPLVTEGSGFQFYSSKCQGLVTKLEQCGLELLHKSRCPDVSIFCDFRNISLRLTGSRRTSNNMGHVEVEVGSGWFSTVCVNDKKAAAVICRQLNLPSDKAALIDGWSSGQETRPLLAASFVCEGSEKSLDECGLNTTADDYYSNDAGVFCSNSSNDLLLIVSREERYPFIEGANRALMCVTPRKSQRIAEYTWLDKAGGRPEGDFLIFHNLTRECNGREVSCYTAYRNSAFGFTDLLLSGSHVLKVYYQPLINITWTYDTGTQQPLSNFSDLNPGQNVTLWCEADSNPPPASITWSGRVNSTTGKLRIIDADHVTHSGLYTCTVITQTVDDDDRLPLTSSYQLTLSVQDK